MIRILSFYHGRLSIWLLLLIAIVGVSIYSLINLSKYGQFFGKSEFGKINLIDLMTYGNIYNGKNICTEGYYVKTSKESILKVDLGSDPFVRSVWIKTDKEIIMDFPRLGDRYVRAEICGFFNSARNGEFGEPPVWFHQITVSSYETIGDTLPLKKF